jgi:uncharacterized repeat protein (TIGR03837 family)
VWRLAQALAEDSAKSWKVRLLVDDWEALCALVPAIEPQVRQVTLAVPSGEVTVFRLPSKLPPADVLVEAFGAPTPAERLEAFFSSASSAPRGPTPGGLRQRVILHLEYLTAEAWGESYHRLPSPLGRPGVERHFFVPGFREHTGGLVFTDRSFSLGNEHLPAYLRRGDEDLLITVFSYEHDFSNLWTDLAWWLQEHEQTARVLVFAGRQREGAVASWERLQGTTLKPTVSAGLSRIRLDLVPFVDQDTYTALVNVADFNVVRGEESWVTAVLSGKPFLWHAYLQEGGHQRVKVRAFLELLGPKYAQSGPEGATVFSEVEAEFLQFNERFVNSADEPPREHYRCFFEHAQSITRVQAQWAAELRRSQKLSRHLLEFLNSYRIQPIGVTR